MQTAHVKDGSLADSQGQSLLEAALLMPLMLMLLFNAVNVAYFSYVLVSLSGASGQGAEYSIQGPSSNIGLPKLPSAADVGTLTTHGFESAVPNSNSYNTGVRVCTAAVGLDHVGTSLQVPQCSIVYGGGSFPALGAADADPEAPNLILNRIDTHYTVTPLIPGGYST